jgi:hypothetical protein
MPQWIIGPPPAILLSPNLFHPSSYLVRFIHLLSTLQNRPRHSLSNSNSNESHCEIPMWMLAKFQWGSLWHYSNEHPCEIPMWMLVKFQWESLWNSNVNGSGISMRPLWHTNGNLRVIPMRILVRNSNEVMLPRHQVWVVPDLLYRLFPHPSLPFLICWSWKYKTQNHYMFYST